MSSSAGVKGKVAGPNGNGAPGAKPRADAAAAPTGAQDSGADAGAEALTSERLLFLGQVLIGYPVVVQVSRGVAALLPGPWAGLGSWAGDAGRD